MSEERSEDSADSAPEPRRKPPDPDTVRRDPRRLRTRAVWLLVVPFFWFATPTPVLLAVAAPLAFLGLAIRGWAAGTLRKDDRLTTSGPYAFTRNPLYIGSFLIGLGVALAGGHWAWPSAFGVFYLGAYGRTLAYETEVLGLLFGDAFEAYRREVPAVLPRLTPYRAGQADGSGGFALTRYMRHREWEASLGTATALGILAAKAFLLA